MQRCWLFPLVVSIVVLRAAPADGQEKASKGLTMAYPSAVGLLWPVTGTFALRPEVSGSMGSATSKLEGEQVSSRDSWSVLAGLGCLFYLREWDDVRGYFVPRFLYGRNKSTTGRTESLSSEYLFSGSFGLQYRLRRRFGIFAELGVGYTLRKDSTTTSAASPPAPAVRSDATTHAVSQKSGIGAVFYF